VQVTNQATGAGGADPSPDTVLTRLALRCLDSLDDLVTAWMAEVAEVHTYDEDLVDRRDLRTTAAASFERILRHIGGLPVPPEVAEISERTGENRARQGVPLSALLDAGRLDFRVVWQALVARADPAERPELVAAAYLVWEAVEGHVTGLMTGYQRTVLEMGRAREDERRAWFTRLADGDGRNRDVVRSVARVLDFDADARFVCAMAPGTDPRLRRTADRMAAAGVRCHRQETPDGDLLVVQVPAAAADPGATAADWLNHVPCALSPAAHGLARVPYAARLAAAAARALPPGTAGPLALDDLWLDVFASQAPEIADELVARVWAPLRELPGSEAGRLAETVRVHLAGTGSVADTASAMYVHRNTVQFRLNRFREITGRDVRIPRDAAVVALALRAAARDPGNPPTT
jgi:hypothetical protein